MKRQPSKLKRFDHSPGDAMNIDLVVLGDDTRQLARFYERLGYRQVKSGAPEVRLKSPNDELPWVALPGASWNRPGHTKVETTSEGVALGPTCERRVSVPTPTGVLVLCIEFERGTLPDLLFVYKDSNSTGTTEEPA